MEQVKQTWEEREVPILLEVYEAEERGSRTDLEGIADATGIELRTIRMSAQTLLEDQYIDGARLAMGHGIELANIRLLPKGRRAIGQWPSADPFDNLTRLLEVMISAEQDPAKRSKLQSFRGHVGEIGRDVVTAVLTAYARQVAGV